MEAESLICLHVKCRVASGMHQQISVRFEVFKVADATGSTNISNGPFTDYLTTTTQRNYILMFFLSTTT